MEIKNETNPSKDDFACDGFPGLYECLANCNEKALLSLGLMPTMFIVALWIFGFKPPVGRTKNCILMIGFIMSICGHLWFN